MGTPATSLVSCDCYNTSSKQYTYIAQISDKIQLMQYKQHVEALINIATNIYVKINYLALKITNYNSTVEKTNDNISIPQIEQDIEANNEIIEEISDTINYLTQQQREIITHNFSLRSFIKENIHP